MTLIAQLGLIGGTMGLFTGFSILSGIEIVYFALSFFFKKIKNWASKVSTLEMEYECFVFDSNKSFAYKLFSKHFFLVDAGKNS